MRTGIFKVANGSYWKRFERDPQMLENVMLHVMLDSILGIRSTCFRHWRMYHSTECSSMHSKP
jgi:hypothetical protein